MTLSLTRNCQPNFSTIGFIGSRGIQFGLQPHVQLAHAQRAAVHRAQHLHVPHWVETEPRRNAMFDQIHEAANDGLGILAFNEVEIRSRA